MGEVLCVDRVYPKCDWWGWGVGRSLTKPGLVELMCVGQFKSVMELFVMKSRQKGCLYLLLRNYLKIKKQKCSVFAFKTK